MPALRYLSVNIPMPEESAERARAALGLIAQHEEDDLNIPEPEKNASFGEVFPYANGDTPPEVAELALALFWSLSKHGEPREEKPMYGLTVSASQKKDTGFALNIYNEFERWIDHDLVVAIARVCQDRLGAGPIGWVHNDDIYGERSEGAVVVPPGRPHETMTLEDWVQGRITALAGTAEALATFVVEPGDRVWDPMDSAWRTVGRVDAEEKQVFFTDGGVMGTEEVKHVLLPSEEEYDPRGRRRPASPPEPEMAP